MTRLDIRLLGPPRVELDGAAIRVDTRKAIALLAYLAVTGARQSRPQLAALLWPDYDGEHAGAALRRTLSVLRKALDGRWLLAERTSVDLDQGGLRLDVEEFRRLVSDGSLERAVSLYEGDFMAGFGLRDSVEFDDWQLLEDQRLRRELALALERLARDAAERGELDVAIGHAERWLALDRLQEPAHRLLMELHAWRGARPAALRQYRDCVRVLSAELGVAALPETTELYEAIKANRLERPAPSPAVTERAGGREAAATYPLVGRSEEWKVTLGEYERVRTDGRVLVLEGEAGIGKTRLADELADRLRERGAAVVAVRGTEGESGLAYGLVAETLRAALARGERDWLDGAPAHQLREAARLVPELSEQRGLEPPPALDSPGAEARFVAALSQVLFAACSGAVPGALLVDDLHWVDEASVEVLAYLARRLERRPVLVVVTWRPDEVGHSHPIRRLVTTGSQDGRATLVRLSRLAPAAVSELALAGGVEELGERLYAESRGLPLFVVEYLAAVRDQPDAEWAIPSGIMELLRSRIASLSETAQQVLATVAVIGRPVDAGTIRDVSGRSEDEAVAALEELTRRSLLEASADGYAFAHELARELVDEDLSMARRRLLHRRAAEALVVRARRDPGAHAARVAEHYRLAGQDDEAAEAYRRAGDHARSLRANVEALAHYRAALALGDPDPVSLHEAIGELLTRAGDYEGALSSFEAAASLADGPALAAIEHRLGVVHHRRGEWEAAALHFQAAAAGSDGCDAGWLARLEADRSLNEHRQGETARALEHALRSLAAAQEAGGARALAQAHNVLGMLASTGGDLDEARVQLGCSLELAEGLEDATARVAALNNLALVERASGELDRALGLTASALALCAAEGDRHREAALENNLADLLRASGRDEEAMEHLKRAVSIFAEVGAGELQPEIWKLVEW